MFTQSLLVTLVVRIVHNLEYQNSLIACVRLLVLFEQHMQCRREPK